jgi:acetylglutamate kinase
MTDTAQDQMEILAGALPFLKRYDDQIIVVKYGGHAMGEEETALRFGRDIALLEQAEAITRAGVMAVGISGKDGGLVRARKLTRTYRDPESNIEKVLDLGFVGEPESINPRVLDLMIGADIVPVVAPVGASADGQTYNINADTVAGAIAGALSAERLLMLTDVRGVLGPDGNFIPEMTVAEVKKGIADGWISGGMIPKVETCIYAVEKGVKGAVILDGRVPHAVLRELFTDGGAGTLIRP